MIKFIGSFDTVESLPRCRAAEYAFIGRSNVGKSSLLNALVGSRAARTSNTPGRTQMINLFDWRGVTLADLPGYGYAKASKTDREKWAARLEKYLLSREQLEVLFILVDSRHGLKDSDIEMMDFCDANAIRYQVVLTKVDKISKTAAAECKTQVEAEVAKRGASFGAVIATSAEKKTGIEELRDEIVRCEAPVAAQRNEDG
ncbi:MAG: ribosome biogenesis GTP-binding protein YihA/YsxC [Alphaproteobacteria bacterium]|nr:ribosome biogenesis GTP-binding protein YihA/YsxC [Alphaproteobacteria bacterium]MCL2757756.1 ribosome biogenesis GTP-binding protein YihA/YsxC [Alphaproteobacteria bacterium]